MINQCLKYSLINHKVITIMYMKGLEITQRRIQVLKIEGITIKALDIDKGELRTFKVENILSAIDIKLMNSKDGIGENHRAN